MSYWVADMNGGGYAENFETIKEAEGLAQEVTEYDHSWAYVHDDQDNVKSVWRDGVKVADSNAFALIGIIGDILTTANDAGDKADDTPTRLQDMARRMVSIKRIARDVLSATD